MLNEGDMESFSSNTKKELAAIEKQKKCCAFSFIYGFLFFAVKENDEFIIKKTNAENAGLLLKASASVLKGKGVFYDEKKRQIRLDKGIVRFSTIVEYKEHVFKCSSCTDNFLRSVFLMCGTVNDPAKSYRLELVFDSASMRNDIYALLTELGFVANSSSRKDKHIIYFRNSEQIENFLARIGAVNATFAIMNSKILKELRNNTNRIYNCDNANINKAILASERYVEAINALIENGKIDALSEQLRETAYKRLEFRELNFEQLGKKFDPPISKSGIYHRLEKILEFYNSLENK